MRSNGFVLAAQALAACLLAQVPAQARCADDLAALQARVDRAQKMNPRPEGVDAAAKALDKYNRSDSPDEVDCYNAVARARRALMAGPATPPAPLGQAQQPLKAQQVPAGQAQLPLGVPPEPVDQVLRPR